MVDKDTLMRLADECAESYDGAKLKLFAKVLGADGRFDEKGIVHTDFEDLSILYYVMLVDDDRMQAGLIVTDSLLEEWGVTQEMLHDDAMKSSMNLFPEKIFDLGEHFGFSGTRPMYVVTNKNRDDGAVVLFYPGVVEKLYDMIGDFVVIPSSVDEMIIVQDDGGYERLAGMVRAVNEMVLPEKDRLSDHIYRYRRSENKLRMVL